MPDEQEAPSGVETEASPEVGETGGDQQQVAEAPPVEVEYIDIDDTLASKHVRINRDGEETSVSLKEALDGYNANSVATKRFQEASQLRQEAEEAVRLQQAMRVNPGLTIQFLAQQAGTTVEDFLGMTPAQQQAAVAEGGDDDEEYMDPLERQIKQEREARLELQSRIEQREADEYFGRVVSNLKSQYGIDDDQAKQVVSQALQMQVGPDMLPMVYESMAYRASQQAQQQSASEREAAEAQRQQAAQQQAALVSGGTSAVGTTTDTGARTFSTIREAALAAIEDVERRNR